MHRQRTSRRQANAMEGAAAAISALCLVHCLALPAFLLLLPTTVALFAKSEWFHVAAIGLVIPIAAAIMAIGLRRHGSFVPGLLAFAGTLCLMAGLFGCLPGASDTMLLSSGSFFLLLSHAVNWRLRAHAG